MIDRHFTHCKLLFYMLLKSLYMLLKRLYAVAHILFRNFIEFFFLVGFFIELDGTIHNCKSKRVGQCFITNYSRDLMYEYSLPLSNAKIKFSNIQLVVQTKINRNSVFYIEILFFTHNIVQEEVSLSIVRLPIRLQCITKS